MSDAYEDFLRAKVCAASQAGFDAPDEAIHPILKPHQRAIVRWMVAGGRRACFAAFGLGKSLIQLEAVRITREHAGGRALIVCPLGVRQEFARDAELVGTRTRFVRTTAEALAGDESTVYITNYESVREGKIDPLAFTVASLDEASCLRGFGGTKTFREFMRLFAGDDRSGTRTRGVPYRFAATATPSPNEFIELLAYSAYLDILDVSQAKTRFFKRDSTKADSLTIHPHKIKEFWLWVSTWALFVQRPSDICGCLCHKEPTLSGSASEGSSLSGGSPEHCETELGTAPATAESVSSRALATSRAGCSSAVVASVQSMEAQTPGRMLSGLACASAAVTHTATPGSTTAEGESLSVSAGRGSRISLPTWDSLPRERLSTASTTAETTSRAIVGGPREPSKPGTAGLGVATRSKFETRAAGTCANCADDDTGYDLPALDVRWHELPTDHSDAGHERDGQARMFRDAALGVVEASRERRRGMAARVEKAAQIVAEAPGEHFLLWHDLEDERRAIKEAIPEAVEVYGSQDLDEREQRIIDFSDGKIQHLATKPVLAGSGCNFQRFCHRAIFAGVGFKFNDFIQAIHRIQRFLQDKPVRIDLIYTEAERNVRRQLERKWAQHEELVAQMTKIIREFGLAHADLVRALGRAFGVDRVEVRGEHHTLVNNDCVLETRRLEENSVGLVLTSVPFSTQYEYSPNYSDFGHTDDNDHFFRQMDFLTPQLLRVLKPGRIAAIHVKDRIVPGGMTGLGFQTVYPFHARCIEHYTRHGFAYMGMKTIVTDVVRENNQTYRLGWTEQCKDGTKMGVGMPEYLLLFRKPPTDTSNSYADEPVVKSKAKYSRARWQTDAHGFARSSGDRPITAEDLTGIPHERIFKLFRQWGLTQVYDFEHHVRLGEALEARGVLPVTFMLLQPPSWHPDVWTDITRMLTLNGSQHAKGKEMHLCPMQIDLADRVIEQMSAPGDLVLDPFGGLMTVPYRAILKGRRGYGIELSAPYFLDGAAYCEAAERKLSMPGLFDAIEADEADEEPAA